MAYDYGSSVHWQEREPKYRKFLADLGDEELLREARISWLNGLQHDPMWREDVVMLVVLCQECEARGLKDESRPWSKPCDPGNQQAGNREEGSGR